MAGMLAGVECARRRRFHQSGGSSDSVRAFTRRPSFCLYTSNHESLHSSVFSQVIRFLFLFYFPDFYSDFKRWVSLGKLIEAEEGDD